MADLSPLLQDVINNSAIAQRPNIEVRCIKGFINQSQINKIVTVFASVYKPLAQNTQSFEGKPV
jgi:hypothetical protein